MAALCTATIPLGHSLFKFSLRETWVTLHLQYTSLQILHFEIQLQSYSSSFINSQMPDRILGLAATYKFFGMFTDKNPLP